MATRDLREKYGSAGSARLIINRAIRAELPGGAEALDAAELFHQIVCRHGMYEPGTRTPTVAQVAHDRLAAILNAMEAEIRRRYKIPQNEQ